MASEGCYEGCFVPDADNNDSQVWAHTVSAIEPGCILLAKPVCNQRIYICTYVCARIEKKKRKKREKKNKQTCVSCL